MGTPPTFERATRQRTPLKLGISGPSGGGKTLGALTLARALAPNGRIALIDTENGSASLYADRFDFATVSITPPYLTKKYLEAMDAALAGGFEVLVVDSISHQWDGEGGILQRKDEADAVPGTNHWTNWGPFTKEHNQFRARILNYPIHLIATMRSKQAHTQVEGERNGRKRAEVVKLGLAPIQREGMDYEFTVCFDIQMDHRANVSKDRTDQFKDGRHDLLNPATAERLLDWYRAGTVAPPITTAGGGSPEDVLMPMGEHEGKRLGDLPDENLLRCAKWCEDKEKYPELAEACFAVVTNRINARNRKELAHAL